MLKFEGTKIKIMTKPAAVIFDMDCVLIDSEPVHCE
jgi:hypothetical protein